MQNRLIDFNIVEDEKFSDKALDSAVQLTIKKLLCILV